ncbi:AAA family ATPase [Nocardioides pakistanensis]
MTSQQAPTRVGIIELHDLPGVLASAGVGVVSGHDYRTAATAIRAGLEQDGPFPILVLDHPWPGMRAWVDKAARDTTVVVLRGATGNGTVFTGVKELTLPVSLGEALAVAGGPELDPSAASMLICADGTLAGPTASSVTGHPAEIGPVAAGASSPPAPVDDPWEAQKAARHVGAPATASFPSPQSIVPPMPSTPPVIQPPSAPTTAATPVAAEDPWEAQRAQQSVLAQQPVQIQPAPSRPVDREPVIVAPTSPIATAEPIATAGRSAPGQSLEPARSNLPASAPSGPQGDCIVVWAGKGGVGKSTFSFSLAQRAARTGLRVVLVDGNFGQGDLRTFLRIGNAGLPSIYQYAVSGDLKSALIDPETLNASRSPKLAPLGFALVQAPPAHLTDPTVVTPEVYSRLVAEARSVADLVVVDTQIIESLDSSGIVEGFVKPLLRTDGWGIGVSELSPPSISNLLSRLKTTFAGEGVPRERMMTALNRVPSSATFNVEGVASAFNEHSVFLGTVFADEAVPESMNRGVAVSDLPVLAPILDAALSLAVSAERGFGAQDAASDSTSSVHLAKKAGKPGGLLKRLRRGRS